jgi:hypothetical protein
VAASAQLRDNSCSIPTRALVRALLPVERMSESTTVSGEIDTSRILDSGASRPVDAVRLLPREDDTHVARPRSWPRATRELTHEIQELRGDSEKLRTAIWCAAGGLLVAFGLYLVF